MAFRRAHLGRSDEAYSLARSLADQWKETYVIHYLDMLATMAWLEYRENGQIPRETAVELGIFDDIDSRGKRALLALQGFLPSSVGTPARAWYGGITRLPQHAIRCVERRWIRATDPF